jgi:hypothetical protein
VPFHEKQACFRLQMQPLSVTTSSTENRKLQRRLDVRVDTSLFAARPLILWDQGVPKQRARARCSFSACSLVTSVGAVDSKILELMTILHKFFTKCALRDTCRWSRACKSPSSRRLSKAVDHGQEDDDGEEGSQNRGAVGVCQGRVMRHKHEPQSSQLKSRTEVSFCLVLGDGFRADVVPEKWGGAGGGE